MAKVKETAGKCWVICRSVLGGYTKWLTDDDTMTHDLEEAMAFTDVNEADRRRAMIELPERTSYTVMFCENAADEAERKLLGDAVFDVWFYRTSIGWWLEEEQCEGVEEVNAAIRGFMADHETDRPHEFVLMVLPTGKRPSDFMSTKA